MLLIINSYYTRSVRGGLKRLHLRGAMPGVCTKESHAARRACRPQGRAVWRATAKITTLPVAVDAGCTPVKGSATGTADPASHPQPMRRHPSCK
jgi:hypothetical protein